MAAQRTEATPLDRLVAAAAESSLLIVLLVDEIRTGTKRELWGVLNHPAQVQVAVLRFTSKPKDQADADPLGKYLEWVRVRKNLVVRTLSTGLNSSAVWQELIRTAVAALIVSYQRERLERERLNETR